MQRDNLSFSSSYQQNNRLLANHLIGLIYDAACDSSKWRHVLQGICQLTHSKSAVLLYQDHEIQHASTFASFGLEPQWLELYNTTYGQKDPALDIIGSVPTGQLTASHLTGSEEELYNSDTYKEFYKPQDIYHLAGTWLLKNDARSALLGFQRPHHTPFYEAEILFQMNELVPHLQRALHIHKIYTASLIKNEAFALGLDSLKVGVIFFNNQLQIIFCNKSAEQIIENHPAITIRNESVFATSAADNLKIRHGLARAAIADQNDETDGITAIGLRHPDATTPLPTIISPIRQSDFRDNIAAGTASIVMTITNPDQMMINSPSLLEDIYGLSPSEAEVALHLANGITPTEIAAKKNVKLPTIRTQLISIYHKVGVKSQAQLIKILLNSAANTLR
ncbi:MAG: hypothetical protein CO186_09965 [Zetaproteobacteria bacterium CG_4_9_14_3_um_filter_49_83]|nr:MAG: hypothetical protein AUJ56_07240 [Zetaproteobacteria bacterium CG1_02_49_23]PIQ34554.1 MAG: hypothetical protein COW62_01205 [Zetaproteobacteria bacterium CG17_big_fil_post_rev_8_21_14_2_50_50_13]PIV29410.1 MAG: hypothetical protein COS35_12140 [Zetaproteobacteria bacterium CG02_land_8_20_14_3_00_50_9]PIY56570.1 MAG: hypothetical protein COZ00_03455 [Zetaproteobacteria bacterium CG_4_10_14_0_8_um_filter_49_80]PJA34615.1 MAG: hypothetical protein CO186_09965 [Zetaproteobacteria bacterium